LEELQQDINLLLRNFQQKRINHQGFTIMLLGAPNAGKSSLFNYLVQEDQAIVTQYPGTTRDILSARLLIQGRTFCLKDNAGFCETSEIIEKKGIEKSFEEIKYADLCLFMVETTLSMTKDNFFGLEKIDPKKLFLVFSKSDQHTSLIERQQIIQKAQSLCCKKLIPSMDDALWVSIQKKEGLQKLNQCFLKYSEQDIGEIFISTTRQFDSLKKIQNSNQNTLQLLNQKASPELTAFELHSALHVLYELLGKKYNAQVVDQIFKEFCLGK